MNLSMLLIEALELAPEVLKDAEQVAEAIRSGPDAAAKAEAVIAGIEHLAEVVIPALKGVGK